MNWQKTDMVSKLYIHDLSNQNYIYMYEQLDWKYNFCKKKGGMFMKNEGVL